jgi:hypothetical protein
VLPTKWYTKWYSEWDYLIARGILKSYSKKIGAFSLDITDVDKVNNEYEVKVTLPDFPKMGEELNGYSAWQIVENINTDEVQKAVKPFLKDVLKENGGKVASFRVIPLNLWDVESEDWFKVGDSYYLAMFKKFGVVCFDGNANPVSLDELQTNDIPQKTLEYYGNWAKFIYRF